MGFADSKTKYNPETEGYGNPSQWRRAFHQRMSPEQAEEDLADDDPFVILKLKPFSHPSKDELKKAYRAQAMLWHPDRYQSEKEIQIATEKMKKINAAHDYLMYKFGY